MYLRIFFFFLKPVQISIYPSEWWREKKKRRKNTHRLPRTGTRRTCPCPDRWPTGRSGRSAAPGRGTRGNRRRTSRCRPRAVALGRRPRLLRPSFPVVVPPNRRRPGRWKNANTRTSCGGAAGRGRRARRRRPARPGRRERLPRAATKTRTTSDGAWLAMQTAGVGGRVGKRARRMAGAPDKRLASAVARRFVDSIIIIRSDRFVRARPPRS